MFDPVFRFALLCALGFGIMFCMVFNQPNANGASRISLSKRELTLGLGAGSAVGADIHLVTSHPAFLGGCTSKCPKYILPGGVSGMRRGEDGYVAISFGPAGPLNVGYYAAPDYTGQQLSTNCPSTLSSNSAYYWCEWPEGVYAHDVTNVIIHGCIVHGHAGNFYSARFDNADVKMEYCEVRPPASVHFQSAVQGGDATTSQFGIVQDVGKGHIILEHLDIWGVANAVTMCAGTLDMEYVWIHDPRDPSIGQDHTDGYLDNSVNGDPTPTLSVRNSTFSANANTNAIGQQGSLAGYKNTRITRSYFSGFAYTVDLCGKGIGCDDDKNNVFADNTFGTDFKAMWGPNYGGKNYGFLWRNNKLKVVSHGDEDSSANNGKYVWPDGTLSTKDFED